MKRVKIMVAYHRPWPITNNSIYVPVHVGRACTSLNLNIQGDDSGDNISSKNSLYCEMTAVYWGWKNIEADYYGLFHYRRFLTFSDIKTRLGRKTQALYYRFFDSSKLHILIPQIQEHNSESFIRQSDVFAMDLMKMLEEKDIDAIFPKPTFFSIGNVKDYYCHIGWQYVKCLEEVTLKYAPDMYRYLRKTLDGSELYAANMFVMKKSIYIDYCETIFPILDKVVESFDDDNWCVDIYKEKCMARFVGYLSELLTSSFYLKLLDDNKTILNLNVLFAD